MVIERVEIRVVKMELVEPFETSFGREVVRPAIIVSVESDSVTGWGECVAGDGPWYSSETIGTASHIMRDFLIPAVLNKKFETIDDLNDLWKRVRGHPMAKAGIEAAVWDLLAKRKALPLSEMFGGVKDRVESGVSIGIQSDVGALIQVISQRIEEGYRRIKLKIKPGWDLDILKEVRAHFGDMSLMADANAAYTVDQIDHIASFDELGLLMIEQPFGYDDLIDHARLQRRIETSVCLDESIKSQRDVEQAYQLGSCKIVNIKPGRVGGLNEAMRIHDLCVGHSMAVWCGGMLETGIGRAHNVALASKEGFSLPNDLSASARYYEEDIIDPPFLLNEDGTLSVPTSPGIGVQVNYEMLERVTVHHEVFQ